MAARLLCGLAPYFTLDASIARDRYGDVGVYGLVQVVWGSGW